MDLAAWHMWWKTRGRYELGDLLNNEWDPIGIVFEGFPADEYSGYGGHIAGRLREGADLEEIVGYLTWARTDRMCLDSNAEDDERVGALIVAWYRDAMAHEVSDIEGADGDTSR
jgi:hypothetical protein